MAKCFRCDGEMCSFTLTERGRCNHCGFDVEDMAKLLPELLMALKGLFVSTSALLLGLHDVLGVSPDDDDFPVAVRATLEQARTAIAMAENCKV